QQSFQISDAQNRKLKLAGEIEIHHFLDDLESIKPRKNQITQEEWQALHQKMQPLKVRYNKGLHGMGSLFRKTIASTLTPEQQASWQQEQQARLQRQYHAAVAATISMIDGQLPLTKKQREMFQTVILTKTVPPSNVPADYLQ